MMIARVPFHGRISRPRTHLYRNTLQVLSKQYSDIATQSSTIDGNPKPNPRWLTELQARINHVSNNTTSSGARKAAALLLGKIESRWLDLLGGRMGFLTHNRWRALEQNVAWGDIDRMLTFEVHVNNVVYNRYVESARVNWLLHHGRDAVIEQKRKWSDLVTPNGIGVILKKLTTEFKFPMTFPDRAIVLYRLREAPTTTSSHLGLEAWIVSEQNKRVAARCIDETSVYDYKAGKVTVFEPFMVDQFQKTWRRQEEHKKACEKEIQEIAQEVERLEKASC